MSGTNWLEVDRDGLAKVVLRRGVAFILYELVQNCWDTGATFVDVRLEPVPGRPLVSITVEDDDPDGFKKLDDAYTLFAESEKKGDPTKRGFLNLGEKLVLAICESAEIVSTKGALVFGPEGRRESRKRRERGTVFKATLRITRAQMDEMLQAASLLLPPIPTRINGVELPDSIVEREFEATLPTMIADSEGYMKPSRRKTVVQVIVTSAGEPGRIYEMGIPVCETGDPWSVNIRQKVPLNAERDNVTPAYLRELRVAAVNALRDKIDAESAGSAAVASALASGDIDTETVKAIVQQKYGDKVMVADIKDKEANNRAVANGYTVIPGSSFSSDQWDQIRKTGAIPVTTTKFATHLNSDGAANTVPEAKVTAGMRRIQQFVLETSLHVICKGARVTFEIEPTASYAARYSPGHLMFNVGRLGYKWFDQEPSAEAVLDLIIHELAHEFEGNHLSDKYHEACTKVGARYTRLAISHPEFFGGALRRGT